MIQDNLTGLFPDQNENTVQTLWKRHLEQTVCNAKTVDRGFEEIDFSDQNIVLPHPPNSLLFLTLNRSSQQLSSIFNDQTLKDYIRDIKKQKRNQPFRMSQTPCSYSKNKKAKIYLNANSKIERIRIIKTNCSSWTCPACAPRKAIAVGKQLTEIAVINNLIYYLTLTLDPNYLTPEDIFSSTHKYITKLFNHFLTVLKRKRFLYFSKRKNRYFAFDLKNSGQPLKYIWVIEFQKNGLAHMHILLNQFLPVEVIRKIWTHVGGGHQMKIERALSIEAVSRYITKYIFKTLGDNLNNRVNFMFFEKRYAVSQSCKRPEKRSIRMFEKGVSNEEIKTKLEEIGLNLVYNKIQDPPSFDINSSDL